MRINKHDTNGVKPLLGKGELGYDDYTAGGDTGRVYVGTGTENIALAEKLEANIMTKAQFNALADERKANRAGSGFDEWGKYDSSKQNVNEGILCTSSVGYINSFYLGWDYPTNRVGISKTSYPIVHVNGVIHKLFGVDIALLAYEQAKIELPTAPTIYPYDTVLTAEQIASGVIKHADASNSGLIVNGKFDTDTSGWSFYTSVNGTFSFSNGVAKIYNSTSGASFASQTFTTIVGNKYIVEANVNTDTVDSNNEFSILDNVGNKIVISKLASTSSRITLLFTATTSTSTARLRIDTNGSAFIDNVAVFPADAISRSDLVFLELTKIAA